MLGRHRARGDIGAPLLIRGSTDLSLLAFVGFRIFLSQGLHNSDELLATKLDL